MHTYFTFCGLKQAYLPWCLWKGLCAKQFAWLVGMTASFEELFTSSVLCRWRVGSAARGCRRVLVAKRLVECSDEMFCLALQV
jgi:hypothetical protein